MEDASIIEMLQQRNESAINELRQKYEAAKVTQQKNAADPIESNKAAQAVAAAETKLVAAEERVAAVKRQIAGLDKARALTISEAANAGKKELEINQLLARGEYEKAAALKLQQELKAKGIRLTEEETKKIQESQHAIGAGNLKLNLAEQARGLRGKAMEQAGRGREFAEEEALQKAAELKKGALSPDEAANVKKIASLTWEMDHREDPRAAVPTIQSNSLSARGGFAGGVKAPQTDQINRDIRESNRKQADTLQRLESLLRKLTED